MPINTGNSITSGLVLAWDGATEHVQSITPTNVSGSMGNDANGDYWQKGADGSYLDFGDPNIAYTANSQSTITVVVVSDCAGGGFAQAFCSYTLPSANNAGWSLKQEQSTSNMLGATLLGVADVTGDVGVPIGFATSGMTISASGLRFAKDGTAGSLSNANTNNGAGTPDTFTVGATRKNNAVSDDLQSGDKIYQVAVWDRELSQAELESVTSDFDQIYQVAAPNPSITLVDGDDKLDIYNGEPLTDVEIQFANDGAWTGIDSIDANGTAGTNIRYVAGSGTALVDFPAGISSSAGTQVTFRVTPTGGA